MTRRVKQTRSILAPLTDNFFKKLSSTDERFRRKLLRYGMWILIICVAYSIMSGDYGIPRIIFLSLEKQSLIEENREFTALIVDSERTHNMLKKDPGYIEQVARNKYFMAKKNEVIYRYSGR